MQTPKPSDLASTSQQASASQQASTSAEISDSELQAKLLDIAARVWPELTFTPHESKYTVGIFWTSKDKAVISGNDIAWGSNIALWRFKGVESWNANACAGSAHGNRVALSKSRISSGIRVSFDGLANENVKYNNRYGYDNCDGTDPETVFRELRSIVEDQARKARDTPTFASLLLWDDKLI